jgi:recombination protein RecA
MSQALRKLAGAISKSNCVAIFINQLREKVGVMYGSPEVTPGGRALKFYASVRIDIRKIETLKNGTELIGSRTRAKVVKNKIAPPFREAEFDVMYGRGISREGELLDLAVKLDVIQKSGAWFSYKETRLGQGRDNSKNFLAENSDIAGEVEAQVKENVGRLFTKNAPASASAAKPVEVETPEPAKNTARGKSADIDISADDD